MASRKQMMPRPGSVTFARGRRRKELDVDENTHVRSRGHTRAAPSTATGGMSGAKVGLVWRPVKRDP
jgi:hypothetical protein